MSRFLPCLAVLMFLASSRAADPPSPIQEVRSVWKEWSHVKSLISEERNAWDREKQSIADAVAVAKQEIAALTARLEALSDSASGSERQRSELLEKIEESKAHQAIFNEAIDGLEQTARDLLPAVPPHLQAELAPLLQRLPAQGATNGLPISQRMQTVIALAAQLDKFNAAASLVTEVKDPGNGKSMEVRTLYFGLGAAFYSDVTGTHAGWGRASEDGWSWTPATGADAAKIASAIRIYSGEEPPAFVSLPAKISAD